MVEQIDLLLQLWTDWWAKGSTSSVVFANVSSWESTLAPHGEYNWAVCLWRQRGLMSNYFYHLLLVISHIICTFDREPHGIAMQCITAMQCIASGVNTLRVCQSVEMTLAVQQFHWLVDPVIQLNIVPCAQLFLVDLIIVRMGWWLVGLPRVPG